MDLEEALAQSKRLTSEVNASAVEVERRLARCRGCVSFNGQGCGLKPRDFWVHALLGHSQAYPCAKWSGTAGPT